MVSFISSTSKILSEIEITERYVHSHERWFGKSADQSGDNWATEAGLTPFSAISGNGAFGADANDEAKVLGSGDTPVVAGNKLFDFRRIMVADQSSTTAYVLRIIHGKNQTMNEAIDAGQYTLVYVISNSALGLLAGGGPFQIQSWRLASGTKVWIQAKNATNNATIDFFIGIHEYPD